MKSTTPEKFRMQSKLSILTIVTGIVLMVTMIVVESDGLAYRVAIGFALLTGLFLIWVNLAIGLIGSENNPANLMYFGVITIGIIGAFLVRFQPQGLAAAMFMVAIARALVAVIALLAGMQIMPGSSVTEIVGVNWFFFILFIIAALLFSACCFGRSGIEYPKQLIYI